MRIPAFINPKSGSAARALDALRSDARFEVREIDPAKLADAVREEAGRGTARVLVSGGDGTIAQAAGAAAGTALEIAAYPGGTLNHFARDAGIPLDDPRAALDLAATGAAHDIDLGRVNDDVVLNTSAVGAYVTFVRTRERLERWMGYHLASVAAAVWIWFTLRGFVVEFAASDGTTRRYRTPLVFVGVGERAFDRESLGARKPDGARKLHVLVVRETTPGRVASLGVRALLRGLDALAKTDALDAYLVDACTVSMRRKRGRVSIDGELVQLDAPLRYAIACNAVRMVTGAPNGAGHGAATSGRSA